MPMDLEQKIESPSNRDYLLVHFIPIELVIDLENGSDFVEPINSEKRALISVSDKTGLEFLGQGLRDLKFGIISTGSTGASLEKAGVSVKMVESLTGYPEILGGRVKTLHPAIFGGILARPHLTSDLNELQSHHLLPIEVVVCNLYPFEEAAANGAQWQELIEKIDIGGVTLLRAAAKNHEHVLVLCDPVDYGPALEQLRSGQLGASERRKYALKALSRTAAYDACIVSVLESRLAEPEPSLVRSPVQIKLAPVRELRYGENPHQKATLFSDLSKPRTGCDLTRLTQLGGKELSYNNYLDVEHGLRLIAELPSSSCVILKHNTPCGVGLPSRGVSGDAASSEAFLRAFEADQVSPFGGVVLFRDEVGVQTANRLAEIFLEVVAAPKFSNEALEILSMKKNLRLLVLDPSQGLSMSESWTAIQGGFLRQDYDQSPEIPSTAPWGHAASQWNCAGSKNLEPLESQWMEALQLAWTCVKHVRSNAIVLASPYQTLAIAGGFTNRVDAVRRCLELRKSDATATERSSFVLASDGFFPFADSIDALQGWPVKGIVQPGGSLRDAEVIAAAERLQVPMYLTGVRHFKH